ncbi:MAG: SDR family NAD(P)-dependent oxidoreductase [Acidimicrobiales bacterium]
MEQFLEGKTALVTGAGPNIGSGIALSLAAYGATVACNDVDLDVAKECVARLERNGYQGMALQGDVTVEDDVAANVQSVLDAYGKIDILVTNAALLGGKGVLDETAENFARAVLVSGLGTFLYVKHVARSMCERQVRGAIVCISSSHGWSASPGVAAYAFHKGGVNNFVRAAAMDLAPYGIRVNGYTPTAPTPDNPDLLAKGVPPLLSGRGGGGGIGGGGGEEPWRRPTRYTGDRPPLVPMGSTGTPTDIGHCVAWMCSDYSRLITGCDFVVDGGARAKNFSYMPAPASELAGPVPLVSLE